MSDPLRAQLEEFMSPQTAEAVAALARMASVILSLSQEKQALETKLNELTTPTPIDAREGTA